MDTLKIIAPGLRRVVRREHNTAQSGDQNRTPDDTIESRSRAVLAELNAKIGPTCHYCANPDLYGATPPGGCSCTRTSHNGAAVTDYRARSYGTPRGEVEIRSCGEILRIR